jgi:DNA-binding protein HU-beta
MNKGGLVAEVSKKTKLNKTEVARVVDASIAVVRDQVAKGERVSLVGFGTFEKKRRNQRLARNPRKPEVEVIIPARDVPSFLPGKAFKDAVSSKRGAAKKPVAKKRSAKRR